MIENLFQERKVYEMPTAEKLREARNFQTEGNVLYHEGQYYRASEKYRKVIYIYEINVLF